MKKILLSMALVVCFAFPAQADGVEDTLGQGRDWALNQSSAMQSAQCDAVENHARLANIRWPWLDAGCDSVTTTDPWWEREFDPWWGNTLDFLQ